MKKLLLMSLAMFSILAASAQNTTYRYHFNNRLIENYFKGPALKDMCSGGYSWESLPIGISHNAFNFDKGCGLVFNDSAGFLASGSYTIELYFMFDTIQGFKKIIDYDSMGADAGFYNQNGKLVLYNNFTSADSFVGAGTFQYIAVTRDGSTKRMYVYHNNKVAGTVVDNNDRYMYGTDKLLIFFKDDKGTGGEQIGGKVAMIHISNYEMDSNAVKANYSNLGKTLDVATVSAGGESVKVYPNPVKGFANVSTSRHVLYTIYDITGRMVLSGELQQGDNKLSLNNLNNGVYLLKVSGKDGSGTGIYKIMKQ